MTAYPHRRTLQLFLLAILSACGGSDGGDTMTPPSVASVTVSPATGNLSSIGATLQLSASAKDNSGSAVSGATISWSSSDESVATVDATGLVTAAGNGTAQITATADGIKGSATVTVAQVAAAVTVAPTSLSLEVGATGQLAASAADANGHAVDGQSVTWSSSDESVATVDATGLVSGVASGSAVITAAIGSASATASVTVTAPQPLEPSQDTTISGTMTVADITIPAGVTLTLDGDVTLTSNGAVSIAGTVTGDCGNVTLDGKSDVTIGGSVTTTCSTPPTDSLPMLSIMSAGLLTLNGANITSGGDLRVGNPGVGASGVAALGGPARAGSAAGCLGGGSSTLRAGDGVSPSAAGTAGGRGGYVEVACSGDPDLGGLVLRAGNGGAGASQETKGGTATATGAPGGVGGNVTLTTDGTSITVTTTMSLIVGDGGIGGNATATSDDPTVKASATGGNGGDSGKMTVSTGMTGNGVVNLGMGFGGLGGFGRADAANGTTSHFDGGDAEGHGGAGGAAPGVVPTVFGTSSVIVMTTAPRGGDGGFGAGEFGSGLDGTADHRDGGNGGSLAAFGGAGGGVSDPSGIAGMGGELDLVLNHGGNGFNACGTLTAGGKGGKGGAMSGSSGVGGIDSNGNSGAAGDLIYGQVALGGNGGDGVGPGTAGKAGSNGVLELGNVIGRASSFKDGTDGKTCNLPMGTSISVTSDPNGHEPYIGYTGISGITLVPGSDGAITLSSSDSRWVELNGTLDGDSFTASGTGTVAGYPNIPVSITGTLTRDSDGNVTGFTGTITVDGSGLPANGDGQHNNVTYDITGTASGG